MYNKFFMAWGAIFRSPLIGCGVLVYGGLSGDGRDFYGEFGNCNELMGLESD